MKAGGGTGGTGTDGEGEGELARVDRAEGGTRCVILCPTRELALQTLATAERLCSGSFNWLVPGCLFGEERRKSEKARIRKGLSIIVATPGRFLDHLTRTESLLMALKGKLRWLVLDEADRLLDMGLGDQVKQIVQRIRANQPRSGTRRDGITWRSVLVSATVTSQVETLAKETLIGGDDSWVWIKGGTGGGSGTRDNDNESAANEKQTDHYHGADSVDREEGYAESTPRQLSQFHMTVSAKLRLSALVAFLTQRVHKRERVVVFMSTCASVDYYHALFAAMDSILSANNTKAESQSTGGVGVMGIFGKRCRMYKLHGNVPHGERQLTMKQFVKNTNSNNSSDGESASCKGQAAILFSTDVAARGLNLPDVDWTVQYDPPSEVADYVHRVGRCARAGRAGHSLLFLLPSERPFLDVLKKRGVKNVTALSLASTLNTAAGICEALTTEGVGRAGGGLSSSGRYARSGGPLSSSRSGEAFSSEVQRRLEECVLAEDAEARAASKAKTTGTSRKQQKKQRTAPPERVTGRLLELARLAFVSHIRAYPTKEKLIRPIFAAKSLHLGHVARSFALKEPPKKLAKTTSGKAEVITDSTSARKRANSAMSFKPLENEDGGEEVQDKDQTEGAEALTSTGSRNNIKKKQKKSPTGPMQQPHSKQKKNSRSLLMANAAKLEQNGMDHF